MTPQLTTQRRVSKSVAEQRSDRLVRTGLMVAVLIASAWTGSMIYTIARWATG
jgi:hypothetical protein